MSSVNITPLALVLTIIVTLSSATKDASGSDTMRRLLQAEPPQTTTINGELYIIFPIAPGQTQLVPVVQGITQNPPPPPSGTPPTPRPANPITPPIQTPTTERPTSFPTQPTTPLPQPRPQTPVTPPANPIANPSPAQLQACPVTGNGEQCQSFTDFVIDTAPNTPPAQIACSADYDCCMCGYIRCGEPIANGRLCEMAQFTGNRAAYGVRNIEIYGGVDPATGAGTMIECGGEYSCANTVMQTRGITELNCVGRHSCQGAAIYIENPGVEFTLECGVTSACEDLYLVLDITKDANAACTTPRGTFALDNIACIGVDSCKGLSFTVINNGCDNVVIQNIECRDGTCNGASFNWYGSSPIGVQSCIFPTGQAMNIPGIERCFTNLQNYQCSAPESCMNQVRTLTNPVNGFHLECTDQSSCARSAYTIQVNANAEYAEAVTRYEIKCSSISSCEGLVVSVVNNNAVPVHVDILCLADGACNDAVFRSLNNVVLNDVLCDKPEQCKGCTSNGIACIGTGAAV